MQEANITDIGYQDVLWEVSLPSSRRSKMIVIVGPHGHPSYFIYSQNPRVVWVSESLIYEARRFNGLSLIIN